MVVLLAPLLFVLIKVYNILIVLKKNCKVVNIDQRWNVFILYLSYLKWFIYSSNYTYIFPRLRCIVWFILSLFVIVCTCINSHIFILYKIIFHIFSHLPSVLLQSSEFFLLR